MVCAADVLIWRRVVAVWRFSSAYARLTSMVVMDITVRTPVSCIHPQAKLRLMIRAVVQIVRTVMMGCHETTKECSCKPKNADSRE